MLFARVGDLADVNPIVNATNCSASRMPAARALCAIDFADIGLVGFYHNPVTHFNKNGTTRLPVQVKIQTHCLDSATVIKGIPCNSSLAMRAMATHAQVPEVQNPIAAIENHFRRNTPKLFESCSANMFRAMQVHT